jgi:hypothetical protein
MAGVIALFTKEAVADIEKQGGTGNWVTSASKVREFPFVVLVRNRNHPSAPSDAEHGTAFLVGRISGARESSETAGNGSPRVFIEIGDYALVNVKKAWSRSQNPVWFTDLDTMGITENDLHFQSIPQPEAEPGKLASKDKDAVLADMKRQIARLFNVPGSAVDISIRL